MRSLMAICLSCVCLGGCFQLGPTRLGEDQVGFSRALGSSERQQTLLNIVRLRYADTPTFLDATQIISGYQLQRSLTGGFEVFPNAAISTFLSGSGASQLQQSPTFTFQPITGDRFAQSFLRPLAVADLLPFAQGGLPIDVLFRLAVQSIAGLRNVTALERSGGEASPDFFRLLHGLRRLQIGGLIGVRIEAVTRPGPDGKPAPAADRVLLSIASPTDPELAENDADVHRLLGLSPGVREMELVYGQVPRGRDQVALLTRPTLGVLSEVAFQIDVPDSDVAAGRTVPSITQPGIERKPAIIVHTGTAKPTGALTDVEFNGHYFWIADDDFDSKVAFTIVNILLDLARTSSSPGTVITIPTR